MVQLGIVWEYDLRIEARGIREARAAVDELRDRFSGIIGATELVPVSRVLKMALTPDIAMLRAG